MVAVPRIARIFTMLALLAFGAMFAGCRSIPKNTSPHPLLSSLKTETPSKLLPSHNRDWMPDLAVLPYAEIDGDRVRLHNIRNCTYQSDDEFVIKHYDRTFDLDEINAVDFIVAPFKEAQGLAHTMLSFGFENGDHVCVSVEARLERDEKYAPLMGAMRQFELMYVVADERDVIVRRTRHRDVDVYLYRTTASPEQARVMFLDVVERVNGIYQEPEFYDTLTNNCTTNILQHINRVRTNRVPLWDLRVLLPGYADQLAYELSMLDKSKPFEQLREEAHINEPANRFATDDNFSDRIRR